MGACASRFKLLKSADDADLPEDVNSSRELKPAGELVKKDGKTPAADDDEQSKRQMLGHLMKTDDVESVAEEANGNESLKVKQESSVADAPAKDAGLVLEHRGVEEVKKSHDGEPASKIVETVVSQKATEEKPVESAKIELSGEGGNMGTVKSIEIESPAVEKSSPSKESKEMESWCLDKAVEEKTTEEKGTQEKQKTDTIKELVIKEVVVPEVNKEEQQEPEVVMEVSVPQTVQNNEMGPATVEEDTVKEQQHAEAKNVEAPMPSPAEAEKEMKNKDSEMTPTLEIPGTAKPDSELEMEIKLKSDEAARLELPERKDDNQDLKETEVVVEKPAAASNAVEKSEDQRAAIGITNIETSAKPNADDIQLVAAETTKIEHDDDAKAQVVEEDKQVEPAKKEQPVVMSSTSEEESRTAPEIKTGQ